MGFALPPSAPLMSGFRSDPLWSLGSNWAVARLIISNIWTETDTRQCRYPGNKNDEHNLPTLNKKQINN